MWEPVDLDELLGDYDTGNTEPCFSGRDEASGRARLNPG